MSQYLTYLTERMISAMTRARDFSIISIIMLTIGITIGGILFYNTDTSSPSRSTKTSMTAELNEKVDDFRESLNALFE